MKTTHCTVQKKYLIGTIAVIISICAQADASKQGMLRARDVLNKDSCVKLNITTYHPIRRPPPRDMAPMMNQSNRRRLTSEPGYHEIANRQRRYSAGSSHNLQSQEQKLQSKEYRTGSVVFAPDISQKKEAEQFSQRKKLGLQAKSNNAGRSLSTITRTVTLQNPKLPKRPPSQLHIPPTIRSENPLGTPKEELQSLFKEAKEEKDASELSEPDVSFSKKKHDNLPDDLENQLESIKSHLTSPPRLTSSTSFSPRTEEVITTPQHMGSQLDSLKLRLRSPFSEKESCPMTARLTSSTLLSPRNEEVITTPRHFEQLETEFEDELSQKDKKEHESETKKEDRKKTFSDANVGTECTSLQLAEQKLTLLGKEGQEAFLSLFDSFSIPELSKLFATAVQQRIQTAERAAASKFREQDERLEEQEEKIANLERAMQAQKQLSLPNSGFSVLSRESDKTTLEISDTVKYIGATTTTSDGEGVTPHGKGKISFSNAEIQGEFDNGRLLFSRKIKVNALAYTIQTTEAKNGSMSLAAFTRFDDYFKTDINQLDDVDDVEAKEGFIKLSGNGIVLYFTPDNYYIGRVNEEGELTEGYHVHGGTCYKVQNKQESPYVEEIPSTDTSAAPPSSGPKIEEVD